MTGKLMLRIILKGLNSNSVKAQSKEFASTGVAPMRIDCKFLSINYMH